MSLPNFDLQGFLFESLGSIAPDLFDEKDKYKLFATKVWPLLVGCREELAQCYEPENGRPGIEPVVLLGVLIFQFMERVPDSAGSRDGKISFGLEAGVKPQAWGGWIPPDHIGAFPATLIGSWKE